MRKAPRYCNHLGVFFLAVTSSFLLALNSFFTWGKYEDEPLPYEVKQMDDDKLDQVQNDLKDHLVECATNYSELKSITEVQNNKLDNQNERIDRLSYDVKRLGNLVIKAAGWIITTLVGAVAYLAEHILK